MPPRFAYWTILIDNAPTAFRAADAAELQPTLHQLKRTNKDVALKWFARGRLWNSREEEAAFLSSRRRDARSEKPREKRGAGWRPGGNHKDPRARFASKKPRGHGPRQKPKGRPHRDERPPHRDERPERREPPPRQPPPGSAPEPPPAPERIVIKPDPPERG